MVRHYTYSNALKKDKTTIVGWFGTYQVNRCRRLPVASSMRPFLTKNSLKFFRTCGKFGAL